MEWRHPSYFEPQLTDEVISFIARPMLDIYNETIMDLKHQFDNAYTRGCTIFGRTYACVVHLIMSGECSVPILLKDGTFKCIFQIGSARIRFCKDDFLNPSNQGFSKKADDSYYELFPSNVNEPVYWKYILNEPSTDEDEALVIFAGYNAENDVVAYWDSSRITGLNHIHFIEPETPKPVDLGSPSVEDPDMDNQKEDDDDSEAVNN